MENEYFQVFSHQYCNYVITGSEEQFTKKIVKLLYSDILDIKTNQNNLRSVISCIEVV